VRVALAPTSGPQARRRLRALLEAFPDRVEVLSRRDHVEPDVVLLDPCVGGRVDLVALGEQTDVRGPVAVYTSEPAVDPLAFAMAGSVMDGRLRGWLSTDLAPEALLDAIERIHGGEIVVEPATG
jgi:hypothetical protein